MTLHNPILRALAPALARPPLREIARASIGAGLALALCGLLRAVIGPADSKLPFLIAPLGASAFLLFSVPNSPLVQPWSVVVGNSLSALVAITVMGMVTFTPLAVALSVCCALAAMMLARAMHPPGAAVALLIALTPALTQDHSFAFALDPVALDSALLVAFATLYNRATGRKYPFRLPPETSAHATSDTTPERRLGLSADELGAILAKMNLAANIGTEDLARLIGAAEAAATARHLGGLTAAEVMSRDVVTVPPDTPRETLADLFRTHRFKTLPVVSQNGHYLGLLSQGDLLDHGADNKTARDLMKESVASIAPASPLASLLALLSDGGQQSVPVVQDDHLLGIVTRSDMIAALAHVLAR